METRTDMVVIGAGQGGMAASWHLTQGGVDHVVLERDRVAESWRSKRWDSFTLVTPAWTLTLAAFAYQDDLGGHEAGHLRRRQRGDCGRNAGSSADRSASSHYRVWRGNENRSVLPTSIMIN